MEVLDAYLMAAWQSKTTMYDFYASLEKLTNNTGKKPPNRYHAFLRMCREWRHLMMLKRAGVGHKPGGVESTKSGELAVLCPVCPRPGRNLPEGWENTPEGERYVTCILVHDAVLTNVLQIHIYPLPRSRRLLSAEASSGVQRDEGS